MPHNAAWSDYAAGFRETVFVCPEPVYGTIVHPAATDAIDFMTASLEFKQERVNRADKTSTRSYRERISHRKETTWSLNMYALPSGTTGVAPDIDPGLVAAFGRKVVLGTVHTHAATPCTPTLIKGVAGEAATALWEKGGAVQWTNALGDMEVSFIAILATDDITVSPPFSAAPGLGDHIYGSVTYFLSDTLSSLCFTRILDNVGDVWSGCFVNDCTFDFPGTGEGTLTLGGSGKTAYLSGTSTTEGDLAIAATVLYVPDGNGKRFDMNVRSQIDSEVVLVTAIAENIAVAGAGVATATKAAGGSLAEVPHFFKVASIDSHGRVGTAGAECTDTAAGADKAMTIALTEVPMAWGYRIYHGTTTLTYDGYKDVTNMTAPSYVILALSEFTAMTPGDVPATQSPLVDRLTIVRAQAGTADAVHASGTTFGPYQPARTVVGSPVSSCLGDFMIVRAGWTRAQDTLRTTQINYTMNNQGTLRNTQYGTCEAIGFKVLRRDVSFSATLWLEPAQAALYNEAKAFTAQEVVLQHGKTKGAIIAFRLPYGEFNIPKVDGGGDDDVMIPIGGIGVGSVTGNDESVVAWC